MGELHAPPGDFAKHPLRTVEVLVSSLVRVSGYRTGEPHFGRGGGGRFDHPLSSRKRAYGTCYCALELVTAIAETVLHDEEPVNGKFHVADTEFLRRFALRFSSNEQLVVADLTGAALKTTIGDGAISTLAISELSQAWGRAIYDHPKKVDGILYMSRHVNDRKALVVFERAKRKLTGAHVAPLVDEPGCARAVMDLRIVFEYG